MIEVGLQLRIHPPPRVSQAIHVGQGSSKKEGHRSKHQADAMATKAGFGKRHLLLRAQKNSYRSVFLVNIPVLTRHSSRLESLNPHIHCIDSETHLNL